ncbi:hypothetical protein [Thiorhodovibrio frisius]|uniref:hypothetical protein n=1 Tax=Thiorhodovibrio frisius TaxID=631362 RepID=UPI0002D58DDD|nr:hypothetical protein [Thiorhodovibrio frisius]
MLAAEHRRIIEDSLATKNYLDMRLRELEYRLIIKMGAMLMAAVIAFATLVKLLWC